MGLTVWPWMAWASVTHLLIELLEIRAYVTMLSFHGKVEKIKQPKVYMVELKFRIN